MLEQLLKAYRRLSVVVFGKVADLLAPGFKPIQAHLRNANIRILLKTWICMLFMTSLLSYLFTVVIVLAVSSVLFLEEMFLIYLVFAPIMIASFSFIIMYMYPIEKEKRRMNSINNNLPFAITHMAAIASAGIPPESMFKLLTRFKEYGEIAEESRNVVRNIKTFGMSSVNALKDAAKRTPSKPFKEMLMGITSTIETGGDLIRYLSEISEKALFDYRIKRERYLKTLSTYADIYTALLVAAPLMFLALLATMSIIGGDIMGLGIPELIFLITWVVLPLMNIGFLVFVHITYPGV